MQAYPSMYAEDEMVTTYRVTYWKARGATCWDPLALADHQGRSHQGQKSYMTKALETRYFQQSPNNNYPGWKHECSILEGMFW